MQGYLNHKHRQRTKQPVHLYIVLYILNTQASIAALLSPSGCFLCVQDQVPDGLAQHVQQEAAEEEEEGEAGRRGTRPSQGARQELDWQQQQEAPGQNHQDPEAQADGRQESEPRLKRVCVNQLVVDYWKTCQ